MSKLFESTEINGIKLANRFVRSATWEGMAAENGVCTQKLTKLLANLAEGGVDAIELSGGTIVGGRSSHCKKGITSEDEETYFRNGAQDFKKNLHVPLILVEGVRTFHLAEKLILKQYSDYISMSQPFIREPDLIRRWASGDTRKANCVSDSQCRDAAMAGEGIYCVLERQHRKGQHAS